MILLKPLSEELLRSYAKSQSGALGWREWCRFLETSIFPTLLYFEASRCDAWNDFCGERPTIEIVGSGLSRRVATGEVGRFTCALGLLW